MAFITFNPFFYYAIHCNNINNYVTLESDGSLPNLIGYKKLKGIVENYIINNGEGVDASRLNEYVVYICDKLLS